MAQTDAEAVRGYLTVRVAEASGRNKLQAVVWDQQFTDAFVKVEIRGGPRNVKVQSKVKQIEAGTFTWDEDLKLEVLEGATELRLMLCKERRSGNKVGGSVVAACGIYVSDVLDAVPIDKYFELFKPKQGGEGGFIRIMMSFEEKALAEHTEPQENGHVAHPVLGHSLTLSKEIKEGAVELPPAPKKDFPLVPALIGAGLAIIIGVVLVTRKGKRKD